MGKTDTLKLNEVCWRTQMIRKENKIVFIT